MDLIFKTQIFEGPLDLLLALITKNKMSIFNIRITELFDQYMEYVSGMQKLDMEIAGEFITMAAELMYIKSRMLLPRNDEDDPRKALVAKLMDYKTAKEAAKLLSERESEFSGRYEKDTDEIKPVFDDNVRLNSLLLSKALGRIFLREEEERQAEVSKPREIAPIIKRRTVSVQGREVYLLRKLYIRQSVHFDEIFGGAHDRAEIVTIFYALLELLRVGRIMMKKAEGDETNSNIILTLNREHKRNT